MVPTFKCQYLDVITGWWVWSDHHTGSIGGPLSRITPPLPNYYYRIRNMQQGKKRKDGKKPLAQAGHLLLYSELLDRSFHKTLIYITALLVLRFSLAWCAYVFLCQIRFWCVVAWNFISMTLMPLKSNTVNSSSKKSKRLKGYILSFIIL